MRMRKKKNLEEKLAKFDGLLITKISEDKNFDTAIKQKELFDYNGLFGNNNPVEMEIGCGKGTFACEIARRNPDINFLAVEKSANVIADACALAEKFGVKNLRFLKCSAEYLPKYIPEHTIGRIYLNFSCPFPKKSYASHRLTADRFLNIYKLLLKQGGEIHQKTDNMHFFEFSLEKYSLNGYGIKNISLDLHNSGFENNIVTEYEKKFSDLGMPIYRVEAFVKNQ